MPTTSQDRKKRDRREAILGLVAVIAVCALVVSCAGTVMYMDLVK